MTETSKDGTYEKPPTPRVTVVIPVYNEEGILSSAVVDLVTKLEDFPYPYEIILSENGSKDRTVDIARELSTKYPQVRLLSHDEPNYGKALRRGILDARGEFVVCDEIDLCDVDFYGRALEVSRGDDKWNCRDD